ncbi:MAG: tetratricopeptide repeat protein [Nitrospirae bacterium]|nr:tetratricopeptide repeat protein [Nitrospirota bacterium]
MFNGIKNRQAADEYFNHSRQLIAEGDFNGAIEENRKVISMQPGSAPADEALFNIGLIYSHYGNKGKDYKKALDYFEQLVHDYPQSPFLEKAKIWVGVLKDIDKTKTGEIVVINDYFHHLLLKGDFRESLREAQNILDSNSPYTDRALFYTGLIYAHYDNPEKDYKKSLGYFERLINEYPQSPLFEQAKIMRGVLNVIEKAKQVDIDIERKKKELTR